MRYQASVVFRASRTRKEVYGSYELAINWSTTSLIVGEEVKYFQKEIKYFQSVHRIYQ